MKRFFHKFFSRRSILGSQKLLRKQRVAQSIKIAGGALIFASFIWSLSSISSATQLTIQNVVVSGNSVIPTNEVVDIANLALQGKYAKLFSKANFLWYPKSEILSSLRSSYSWLDSVSIDRINLTTIEIKIKERVPIAVWCGVMSTKPVPCRLVDKDANLFASAPDFAGPAYLRLYGPLTSSSLRGAKFFSNQGFEHILLFTKNLREIDLQPVSAEVELASAKDEYVVVLDSGSRISLQVADPVPVILSNLKSLLAQKLFTESAAKRFSNLVSLDMRFGNKIFYKFKDSVPAAATATGTSTKI